MNENNQAVMTALGYPMALPQTVESYPTYKQSVQRTQYAPEKMDALMAAVGRPVARKSKWETIADVLAHTPEARSFTGAYGSEVINPWAVGLSSLTSGFGNAYANRLAAEREAANTDRENAIKAVQLAMEADKRVIATEQGLDWIKKNIGNADGDVAYRFEPERIENIKELNDKAGRWATQWGKGISDMANTEQSQAYNEFEGKAKQYVQDQLKKIYGAQMTEQEGERFFKSMGLSPYLDPDLRWRLVENALEDLARKNGTSLYKQTPVQTKEQQAAIDFMKGTI